ncbi:MAG: hypothetical protein KC417_15205 [Myxococcales bacterium]|nr:hypothetical protein [Myxococcales bacterium]
MRKLAAVCFLCLTTASFGCTASDATPLTGDADRGPAGKADSANDPVPDLPDTIHWVRNSAEYRAATLQAYAFATMRLEQIVTAEAPAPDTWAVSLDADETVLSNSLFELEQAGKAYDPFAWADWVYREEATAIAGAAEFMDAVHRLGGYVAIVTNRSDALCEATESNLTTEGLPFDFVLCKTGSSQKEGRWASIEDGTAADGVPPLEIKMWVGDNIQDFPSLSQSIRTKPDSAFAGFGAAYFVIPNPMYGSWLGNPRE